MATIDQIKQAVDLHDLAARLNLDRPQDRGNYRSPHHADKSPSLSIFDSGARWKDFSGDAGGDAIDLVRYVQGCDAGAAIKWLHAEYGLPDTERPAEPLRERTRAEFIADQVLREPGRAIEYLVTQRGLDERAVERAIAAKTVGYNDWCSPSKPAGEFGHGGPAAAFVVRSLNPGAVVAVDLRYLDADLNGGVKTQTHGDKAGTPWLAEPRRLAKARTVYVVESPINALTVDSAGIKGAVGLAVRGVNVDAIDWRILAGKQVIGCFDADEPNEQGHRPGPEAAWRLCEALTGENIAVQLVDQLPWYEEGVNDLNDVLNELGPDTLKAWLLAVEPWAISGYPGKVVPGRSRVFLPGHDWAQYWRYRVKRDFTTWIKKLAEDDDKTDDMLDVCGFRVAGLARVRVAGATATLSGEQDTRARDLFGASVQVPRTVELRRRTLKDEDLHNLNRWAKFGPIYNPQQFMRLINILERTADLGGRDVINFVGLAWLNGRPRVNEGADCYFEMPEQQCPYHALSFPVGRRGDAETVIRAYQGTFRKNAAAFMLTWALGAHLKAFLGFWPHLTLESSKGAGKSTLTKRLERTIGMTMFGRATIATAFRMLCTLSGTSHPVGFEELSAGKQETIDAAVGMLQESYQYTTTVRGADLTEFLICAPVLLAGEDVPVRPLLGKVVRAELSGRQGDLMPEDLPVFPVRAWLDFLATLSRELVSDRHAKAAAWLQTRCRAPETDPGARRMVQNYAAVALAWRLLCEFSGFYEGEGGFLEDLVGELNAHIAETDADREPWVWILEIVLSEIDAGKFAHPYAWDIVADEAGQPHECLILRTAHCIDHIAHASHLRDRWNGLSIKSNRAFRRQVLATDVAIAENVERSVKGKRISNCVALSCERLAGYGLFAGYQESGAPGGEARY